ncbi:MAG: hypothetical protein KBT36_04905 [Kurthia sp.]|nr:hypothetical protein [Candidatus Kurthia equi]
MKRSDIDLVQCWLFHDQLSEQQVHERIKGFDIKIDVDAAIGLAKLQKEYERGKASLNDLLAAFKQHNITNKITGNGAV